MSPHHNNAYPFTDGEGHSWKKSGRYSVIMEEHNRDLISEYVKEPTMKGHKHAALMLQYAQDAAETDIPWERWQVRTDRQDVYVQCFQHPAWMGHYDYRRKPRTITVNGFEVPEPMKNTPTDQMTYFVTDPVTSGFHSGWEWKSDTTDKRFLNRGLIHSTKEAAIAHAKAMLGIDPNAPDA